MKLNSITLQNFKGIDNLEIKLDNKTTVIFGVNGVGKSTILQAIDLLYADIIAIIKCYSITSVSFVEKDV